MHNEQIIKMIKEMQNLKNTKILISGFFLIMMGGIMFALSQIFEGTNIQDFLSGFIGIHFPVSHFEIVLLETPIFSASCSCVKFFSFRF